MVQRDPEGPRGPPVVMRLLELLLVAVVCAAWAVLIAAAARALA